jgi:4'-phosphopantetheinyl transferase EntD
VTSDAPILARILPAEVAVEEALTDPPEVMLYPAEQAAVERAVAKRRAEFGTARHCARLALARLGLPPAPILPGPRGAPQWPAGVVGSMTHCVGYRAAALAHARDVRSVGVDAEPHEALPDGVLDLITSATERELLAGLAAVLPDVHWGRLLFSAKESVYKAWFPIAGRWLGFEEAELTIEPAAGEGAFSARILTAGPAEPAAFAGRFLVTDGLILTAISVPAGS